MPITKLDKPTTAAATTGAQTREGSSPSAPPAPPKKAAPAAPVLSAKPAAPAVAPPLGTAAPAKVTLAEAKELAADGIDDFQYPKSGKYLLSEGGAQSDTSDVAHAKLAKAELTLGRMDKRIKKLQDAAAVARDKGDFALAEKLEQQEQLLKSDRNLLHKDAKAYRDIASKRHADLPMAPAAEGKPAQKSAASSAPTAVKQAENKQELSAKIDALHARYGALGPRLEKLRKLSDPAYSAELKAIRAEAKAIEKERKDIYTERARLSREQGLSKDGKKAIDAQLVSLEGVNGHIQTKAAAQDLAL